ncbi:CGNR zinc finger domain-containing protein [Streptomyces sp. 7R007]
MDLLGHADSARVKGRQHPDCTRLFLDLSRATARRWCGMTTCGNRRTAQVAARGVGVHPVTHARAPSRVRSRIGARVPPNRALASGARSCLGSLPSLPR